MRMIYEWYGNINESDVRDFMLSDYGISNKSDLLKFYRK